MRKECKDHLGNTFKSINDKCRFYKIDRRTYQSRKKKGWSEEDALLRSTTSSLMTSYKQNSDHRGNIFSSITEKCNYWDIPYRVYNDRKHSGWTEKKALETPINVLRSNCAKQIPCGMLKNIKTNLPVTTVRSRIENGWNIQDATSIPADRKFDKVPVIINGIYFNTRADAAKHFKIPYSVVQSRIYSGWNIEEALTIPRNMYIGEYRVAESLKRLNVKFYHDCTIKTIFKELDLNIDWNDFLNSLQKNLASDGINWSKERIQRLRPDFVLCSDEYSRIKGVIEFDGAQHQKFTEHFHRTIEDFLMCVDRDSAKQSLWEYMEIPFLHIRDDQIDMIDDMVKHFISNPDYYIHNHNTYLDEDEYWEKLEKTIADKTIAEEKNISIPARSGSLIQSIYEKCEPYKISETEKPYCEEPQEKQEYDMADEDIEEDEEYEI